MGLKQIVGIRFTSPQVQSTYSYFLLQSVQNRKAVINIQNKDEKCFLLSVYMEILMEEILSMYLIIHKTRV